MPNNDAMTMSPDFQHYATWSREEGKIYIRRCSDQGEMAQFPALKDSIWPVVFSPDGRYLGFSSYGDISDNPSETRRSRLEVWDWQQRTLVLTDTDEPTNLNGLAFSPDNSRVLVSCRPGKVVNYDLRGNKPPTSVPVSGVANAFHPDGTKVAVLDGSTVTVCDAVTWEMVPQPWVAPSTVYCANWSPDGRFLAIGCDNTRGYLIDADTGAMRAQLVGHLAEVNRVFFSPDGSILVSTDYNGVTCLWDVQSGRQLLKAQGTARCFSRDGTQLTYVNGTQAGVWQVAAGREYREWWGHTCFKGPGGVRWAHDGSFVASSGDDATRLWDSRTGKQIALIPVGGNCLRFHPNGKSWYTGGASGLHCWPVEVLEPGSRLRIGPPENLYEASAATLNGLDLSLDGRWLVMWDRLRGQVIVRSTTNPAETKTFSDFAELVGAGISPDNRWLVVGGWPHHFLYVYDLTTEQCVYKHSLITSAAWCFSPDAKWLAVGNAEGGSLVKVGSWTIIGEIPPRNGNRSVTALSCSRNGRILAIGRQDHVIQLLDVNSLAEFAALESPNPTFLNHFEFSPDGSRLAVACRTRIVHVWDLRAIRSGLAELGLDWDAPPYPEISPNSAAPPTMEVIAKGLIDPAALQRGLALNNQAWQLLTGPANQRDAAKALTLIEEAVKLRPDDATLLNTLGVAQYYNAQYGDAVATFDKSLAAGKGQSDGFDLFFVAMSHAKLDEREKARECFNRAVGWVEQQKNLKPEHIAELKQIRAEAEDVLGEK